MFSFSFSFSNLFYVVDVVVQAYVFLGDLFYYGLSVQINMVKAADHYLQAADARHPQALYNMGYMHQWGLGVAKDFYLAKRYFDMVGTHHHGSLAASYTALMILMAIWGSEIFLEKIDGYGDSVLIVGVTFMLASVIAVLFIRLQRR